MKLEFGFQPNCSETVFRFSRRELSKLSPDMLQAFWVAAANGCTKESLEKSMYSSMSLPGEPSGGEYSSLNCQDADHFVLAYYQTSNEYLMEFAKNHMKNWLVEAPFTPDKDVPKRHNFDNYQEPTPTTGFEENPLPPSGFEAIIELRRLAEISSKEHRGQKEVEERFANLGKKTK